MNVMYVGKKNPEARGRGEMYYAIAPRRVEPGKVSMFLYCFGWNWELCGLKVAPESSESSASDSDTIVYGFRITVEDMSDLIALSAEEKCNIRYALISEHDGGIEIHETGIVIVEGEGHNYEMTSLFSRDFLSALKDGGCHE